MDNQTQKTKITENWQSILHPVDRSQPLLKYALSLQDRAATVGFDWPNIQFVLDKIEEEIKETIEAVEQQNQSHIEEEFGDLLFAVVNLARHLKVDPEKALNLCCEKFHSRFNYIEQQLVIQNKDIHKASLDEMEILWNKAKII